MYSRAGCHRALRVKGEEPALARARKLLFWAARMTLASGLNIAGLTPIQRM